jgi:hypothetical protein
MRGYVFALEALPGQRQGLPEMARQPELPISEAVQTHRIDFMKRATDLTGRQRQMGFGEAKKFPKR